MRLGSFWGEMPAAHSAILLRRIEKACTSDGSRLLHLAAVCGLIAPQEPLNGMDLKRSIVATLVILAGVMVEAEWQSQVTEYCVDIPSDCFGTPCSAITGTLVSTEANPNVAKQVCVSHLNQGAISNPFTMVGCANGRTVNAAEGDCPSKFYVYTKNANGDKMVFRWGPYLPTGLTCGAQRGFCAPGLSATAPTIDTAAAPYQIVVGNWKCNLQTGFAGNSWQLGCLCTTTNCA